MDTNGHEWATNGPRKLGILEPRMDTNGHEVWEYLNHEWTRMDTNGHEVWEYLNHETHENMIGWEKPSLS